MENQETEIVKLRLALELIKQKTDFSPSYDVAGVCKQARVMTEIHELAKTILDIKEDRE